MMPPNMDPELTAYYVKTEKELSEFRREVERDLKEWRHEIAGAIRDISTETRERFQRADGERGDQYGFQKTEFRNLNEKVDRLTSLAESTNGKVKKHEEEICGADGEGGLKKQMRSVLDSRTWLTVLIGFICTLSIIWWTVWGAEVKARGLVNKTEQEEIELINKQIWKHNHPNGNTNGAPKPDDP